jgi:hypothetical protein
MPALARILLAALVVLLLSACAPPGPAMSAWGEIVRVAQADAVTSPAAAWTSDGRFAAAWVGSDGRGVHHDLRVLSGGPVTLPLPPRNPYAQVLLSSSSGFLHLLWLDVDERGQTALYNAYLSPDQTVERGPAEVSSAPVTAFAAVRSVDGRALVVWTQGTPPESGLFAAEIDASGRPGPPVRIAGRGYTPAMVRTQDGSALVYWRADARVFRARLSGIALLDVTDIGPDVALEAGDALLSLSAGLGEDAAGLFWNVLRADGRSETWGMWGEPAAAAWSAPSRLTLAEAAGVVNLVSAPGEQTSRLTLAARVSGGQIGVLVLEDGRFVLREIVVTNASLAVPPALLVRLQGHLTLAWYNHLPGEIPSLLMTTQ